MSRPRLVEHCIEDGCGGKVVSRGLCGKHYLKWYRAQRGQCVRAECPNNVHAKGLCHYHYKLLANGHGSNRPPAVLDTKYHKAFLMRSPYDAKADGLESGRDKPLWVLEEEWALEGRTPRPHGASVGKFVDAPMRDRPNIKRGDTARESGIMDWSNKQ